MRGISAEFKAILFTVFRLCSCQCRITMCFLSAAQQSDYTVVPPLIFPLWLCHFSLSLARHMLWQTTLPCVFWGFVKHLVTDGLIILVFKDAQYIGPITYQFLFIYLFIMCQTILDILNLKLNIYFTLYIIMLWCLNSLVEFKDINFSF